MWMSVPLMLLPRSFKLTSFLFMFFSFLFNSSDFPFPVSQLWIVPLYHLVFCWFLLVHFYFSSVSLFFFFFTFSNLFTFLTFVKISNFSLYPFFFQVFRTALWSSPWALLGYLYFTQFLFGLILFFHLEYIALLTNFA